MRPKATPGALCVVGRAEGLAWEVTLVDGASVTAAGALHLAGKGTMLHVEGLPPRPGTRRQQVKHFIGVGCVGSGAGSERVRPSSCAP